MSNAPSLLLKFLKSGGVLQLYAGIYHATPRCDFETAYPPASSWLPDNVKGIEIVVYGPQFLQTTKRVGKVALWDKSEGQKRVRQLLSRTVFFVVVSCL